MTQFFNKFKKPCFWPIFPIYGAKRIFLENLALSRTTSYGFLAPCQIQRKCLDRQKDGRTDRPYFIGPFWLAPGNQKDSFTRTNIWHFSLIINHLTSCKKKQQKSNALILSKSQGNYCG